MSNIYDGTFCEISARLKAVNYFLKKLCLRSLTGPCLILTILCANKVYNKETKTSSADVALLPLLLNLNNYLAIKNSTDHNFVSGIA